MLKIGTVGRQDGGTVLGLCVSGVYGHRNMKYSRIESVRNCE